MGLKYTYHVMTFSPEIMIGLAWSEARVKGYRCILDKILQTFTYPLPHIKTTVWYYGTSLNSHYGAWAREQEKRKAFRDVGESG